MDCLSREHAGKKGAMELRDAARALDLPVRLCGPVTEETSFWQDVRTEYASAMSLDGAAVVVLPAWVEHWPRRLLTAVAAGIPVIASHARGLEGVPRVTTIANGDSAALQFALAEASPCFPRVSAAGC